MCIPTVHPFARKSPGTIYILGILECMAFFQESPCDHLRHSHFENFREVGYMSRKCRLFSPFFTSSAISRGKVKLRRIKRRNGYRDGSFAFTTFSWTFIRGIMTSVIEGMSLLTRFRAKIAHRFDARTCFPSIQWRDEGMNRRWKVKRRKTRFIYRGVLPHFWRESRTIFSSTHRWNTSTRHTQSPFL